MIFMLEFGIRNEEEFVDAIGTGKIVKVSEGYAKREGLLIPIASNLDLVSVELAMKSYGVNETPSILIDEEKIVSDIIMFEEIQDLIFST